MTKMKKVGMMKMLKWFNIEKGKHTTKITRYG